MNSNSNSKKKKKIDLEREANWNNRFNILEDRLFPNNNNCLKPKNLRLETNIKNKGISRNEFKSNKQSLINSKSYSSLNRNHSPEKPKVPKSNSFLMKDPLYNQIKKLWDKLGFSKYYQIIFDNVCVQLSPTYREGYFNNEINHLNAISNLLSEINSNIEKRKNIINLLKQYTNINFEGNDNFNELIQNVITLLNELRKISILIVGNYGKLRELIGYDLYINKFENDKINDNNKDNLIELKNDTDFFHSSNLSNYFSFANENDPFLTAIANPYSDSDQYISIPIDEDSLEKIKNCQYILLNEILNNEFIKNNTNYRNLTCPTNNSSHSLISIKSTNKLNKSVDTNSYLNDSKNHKKIPTSKKMTNVSIKSYNSNYNKRIYGIKKQIPINNILIGSKNNSRYNPGIRTPSRKKGKYEESKSEYKSEYSRQRIDLICERKKNEFNHRINEKIKNQRNYQKSNLNTSPMKEDNYSEDYINRSMHNQKIQIDQQSNSKKSFSKNEFSVQTYNNNIENTSENCSKNEEEQKDIISNVNQQEIAQIKEKLPLKIELFSGNILDIKNKYKSIINIIPEEQKKGFQIKNDLSYYLKGVYPKLMIIEEGNIIKGLSMVYYDPFQICKSLKISFICTIESAIFSESLQLLINFCNENLEYDEIKIDLFYGIKDGQFYLIESLEKCIKDDVKFKWVNMENDGKDRKIQYKYVNPTLSPEAILTQTSKNIIELKTACIISLDSINVYLENTGRKMNELNNFGIMSIIEELVSQYGFKIDDTHLDSKFQEFLKSLRPNKFRKMTNDFIQNLFGGSNDVISFIKENLDELSNEIYPDILNNDLLGVSLMKVECAFENVIQTVINGYNYNIISNIDVFTYGNNEKEIEYFYFLRNTNDNLAFIIYELKSNSSLNNLINMNSETDNIYDEFQRIYTKMNNQSLKSMKRIFLPSFKIEKSKFHKKPSFLNAIQLSNDEGEFQITYLNQVEKFNFSNDNNNKLYLFFDNFNENDIIIKNTFLMVIINTDLLCDLQIPTISSFVVQKEFWEKDLK